MRRTSEVKLSDLLSEFVKDAGYSQAFTEIEIRKFWDQLVGPDAARATRRLSLEGKVLTCTLTSSVIRNMLHYSLDGLILELNAKAGREVVNRIVLR